MLDGYDITMELLIICSRHLVCAAVCLQISYRDMFTYVIPSSKYFRRIRDKYEGEITELERAEKLTTSRYNKTKAELIECQGENERMKVILRQKEKEVQELKKVPLFTTKRNRPLFIMKRWNQNKCLIRILKYIKSVTLISSTELR